MTGIKISGKKILLVVPLLALAGLIWTIVYYLYGAKKLRNDPRQLCSVFFSFAFNFSYTYKNLCFPDSTTDFDFITPMFAAFKSWRFYFFQCSDYMEYAVNTASRMESSGEAGKIQISQKFYEHIKDDYESIYCGQTEIKGKGLMNLYFLLSKKTLL